MSVPTEVKVIPESDPGNVSQRSKLLGNISNFFSVTLLGEEVRKSNQSQNGSPSNSTFASGDKIIKAQNQF